MVTEYSPSGAVFLRVSGQDKGPVVLNVSKGLDDFLACPAGGVEDDQGAGCRLVVAINDCAVDTVHGPPAIEAAAGQQQWQNGEREQV